jgi:thiol-disulfide isomerase/thioredoxin
MRKLYIIVLILFSLITACEKGDRYKVNIHLEGIRYDSLSMVGENFKSEKHFKINGRSINGIDWKFEIPDSIYNSFYCFRLLPRLKNVDGKVVHLMVFISTANEDTVKYGNITFDKSNYDYKLIFKERIIEEDAPIYNNGEIELKTAYYDRFQTSYSENSEQDIAVIYNNLLRRYQYSKNLDYNTFVQNSINEIKKHPDSHYLIGWFSEHLNELNSKEDVRKIFDAFSDSNRQSEFGKIISDYIKSFFDFSNSVLPAWDTEKLEPIIQDSSKINLVIFSASWCLPCRKEIPVLKVIYHDLNNDVSMTYVSMDKPETVKDWKEMMVDEQIPWRSVLAAPDYKEVNNKYGNPALPTILLVYPTGKVEKIDIRQEQDRTKLYKLVGKRKI